MDSTIRIYEPEIKGEVFFYYCDVLYDDEGNMAYLEGVFTSDSGWSRWAHLEFEDGVPALLSLYGVSGEWEDEYYLNDY